MTPGTDIKTSSSDALRASPRLFDNDLLDKLSRVHHLTPVVLYTPIILWLAMSAWRQQGAGPVLVWFLLGLVAWSLTEYLGHRFLFHTIFALPFGMGPRLQFLIHGVHHIHPNDPKRLVMPPLLSAPIMLAACAVIRLLLGGDATWPVLAGFMSGYVGYDCVHYWVHHGRPRSRVGRYLRLLHMRHHFRDPARNFGVLAVWWDRLLGTAAGGHGTGGKTSCKQINSVQREDIRT